MVDMIASFTRFPWNHQNTIVVFNQLKKQNKAYQAIQTMRYDSKMLRGWGDYQITAFFNRVDKMQAVVDVYEELLRTIAGYNSAGIEGPEMEILLEPLLLDSGWYKKKLDVACEHAYFVEYGFGDFKMMFIKSILPANDYRNMKYNNIEVTFTYEGYAGGGSWYVGGNKYRMIQFKDDENTQYYRVVKAKSEKK
ncbi:hypothetical protein [Mediterranea sp. An20]|uniref:hypothetical protein n=1 Tax=Mediterranea sp. An20 TaxID=1965586 RepID=UPI001EF562DA|nr:hypothetical protein [Mediterranea sp. An20]